MSPVYRTLADLTPAQRRRLRIEKLIMPTWNIHAQMGGYQEPRPSERRHHWVPLPWAKVPPGGMCSHCGDFLPRSGPPSWRCRGPGFP